MLYSVAKSLQGNLNSNHSQSNSSFHDKRKDRKLLFAMGAQVRRVIE